MPFLCDTVLILALLLQAAGPAPQASPASPTPPEQKAAVSATSAEDLTPEQRLLKVKRIFVESFGDDPISKQIHAMVITGLTETKRFIVTENKDRADAILKGTGLEKTSQEVHAYSESTAAGGFGASVVGNTAAAVGHAAGISDAATHTETINDARIAVRLVDRDGDVIWTTAQESKGAKYKGATADVAEKVVKQLMRDLDKLDRKQREAVNGASK